MLRCDHGVDEQVAEVFRRIEQEAGRLDLLVNNAFQMPRPADGEEDPDLPFRNFWEQPPWFWDALHTVGLRSHYVASHFAFPLLRSTKQTDASCTPLIVHISSFGAVSYSFNVAYGVGKAGVDKLARDMAQELRPEGIACLALYPGVVRTERMQGILDGGEWTRRTGLAALKSCTESPVFAGRVIAALYEQSQREGCRVSGQVVVAAEAARTLGVRDEDGSLPPSIRSLRFLIPSLVLGRAPETPAFLRDLLEKFSPDFLLPMSMMGGGPPNSQSTSTK